MSEQKSLSYSCKTAATMAAADKVSEEQRKRASEALERRFAVAKAELLQQQQQKRTKTTSNHPRHHAFNSPSSSSRADTAPATPFSASSSNKGSAFFSGHASSQDIEDSGLTYSQLSQSVHENLLTTNVKFQGKRGSTVDKILNNIFQHGDVAQKYMQGSRSLRIDNWILLDNFVHGRGKSTGSVVSTLRMHSKCSKKHMSMKQHKKCGLLDLPQDLRKFEIYKPMHEMWKGYMMQLLKNVGRNQLAQCLLNADLHGAIVQVVECKISSLCGVSGIMIRETAETFGIISQDDKFQVVPKKLSVFIFQVDCWKITLQGDKLTSRNLCL